MSCTATQYRLFSSIICIQTEVFVISIANVGSMLAICLQHLSGGSACCCYRSSCTVFGDWVWYRFGVKCMLLFNEAVVWSGGVAVSVWTGSRQLRTQVCWLSRGERLERAVPVSLRYHLAIDCFSECESHTMLSDVSVDSMCIMHFWLDIVLLLSVP